MIPSQNVVSFEPNCIHIICQSSFERSMNFAFLIWKQKDTDLTCLEWPQPNSQTENSTRNIVITFTGRFLEWDTSTACHVKPGAEGHEPWNSVRKTATQKGGCGGLWVGTWDTLAHDQNNWRRSSADGHTGGHTGGGRVGRGLCQVCVLRAAWCVYECVCVCFCFVVFFWGGVCSACHIWTLVHGVCLKPDSSHDSTLHSSGTLEQHMQSHRNMLGPLSLFFNTEDGYNVR